MDKQRESIFLKYAEIFATDKQVKALNLPLKEHYQIQHFIDILSRREHHHILLQGASSEKTTRALMISLAQHLSGDQIPRVLREAYFIYFDVQRFSLLEENLEHVAEDFLHLTSDLSRTGKQIIFVINEWSPLFQYGNHTPIGFIGRWIKQHLVDGGVRFILFTSKLNGEISQNLQCYFENLIFQEPEEQELLSILHTYRDKLESFHHVIIPDEILQNALALAKFYFAKKHALENALDILDSAAAKTSLYERSDNNGQATKPVVTFSILANILAHQTEIPATLLHHNKYKAAKFFQGVQKRVLGQDAAINLISSTLQHASLKLQKQRHTLANFLFVGPQDVGKTEMAHAMAEQMYGCSKFLLTMVPQKFSSVENLEVTTQKGQMKFLDAMENIPYAIVLIKNIDENSLEFIQWLHPILLQGAYKHSSGKTYLFDRAIFIITTLLASEKISQEEPNKHPRENTQVDLMQLVLNDAPATAPSHAFSHLSPHEISEDLSHNLSKYFSSEIMREFHVIPFMTLDYSSIEKIIRLKINNLCKQLQSDFDTELSYTPEIIRFLTQEILWRKDKKSLKNFLEQHLYSCVAHELLSHVDDKHRPRQFVLQLNANGQMLKCEPVLEAARF